MEVIKIKGTSDTPNVILDAANNIIEFAGRSLPENVSTFYGPILTWLDEYAKNPNPKTIVVFKFEYFNTASSKMILDVLLKFEEIHSNGNEVLIQWHHQAEDEDMEEACDEYAEIVEIPFEKVAF